MTGFIRGLFGGGNKPKQGRKSAYFLEPDDAKTFGNIDFMRKVNTIERTFPKPKGVKPSVNQVSSNTFSKVDDKKFGNSTASSQSSFSSSQPSTSSFKPSTPASSGSSFTPSVQRSTDSGMDMFRKMAKNIKKR